MAGLPLYELKKTLEFYSHKCDTAYANDEYCSAKVRTQSIAGRNQRDLAVVEKTYNKTYYNGISDKMYDKIKNFKDRSSKDQETNIIASSAKDLRDDVEEMLEIRNGDMSKTREYCTIHAGTECLEHKYSNYKELMKAVTGMGNNENSPMSSGDIYNAIPYIPYCTCNVRFVSGCICVIRRKYDHCTCHQREVPPRCQCQGRFAGKYADSSLHCSCNSREQRVCNCVGRTSTLDCQCHGRCDCNGKKEFSYTKPDYSCLCNEKAVHGCQCDAQRTKECTAHYCYCYARSSKRVAVGSGFGDVLCEINAYGTNFAAATYQEYTKRINNGDYNNKGGNLENWESSSGTKTCTCVDRCACNTLKIEQGTSNVTIDYAATECTCNYRGGEHCSCKSRNTFAGRKCTGVSGVASDTCNCYSRTQGKACQANTYTDEDGNVHEYSSDSEDGPMCTCQSRTADPACQCNQRQPCDCVYRTAKYSKTLDVYKDIMKTENIDEIHVP